MHLGDDPDVTVLEALDDVHLPQRAAPVERTAGDVTGDVGQLVVAAGRGGGDAPQVVVEVEVGVLDPHRVVEIERDGGQSLPELRKQMQSALEELLDRVERVATLDRRRVERHGRRHVHVVVGRLEIQEAGVQPTQAFHQ